MIGIEQVRRAVHEVSVSQDPHPDIFATMVVSALGMDGINFACPVDRQVLAMVLDEIAALAVA